MTLSFLPDEISCAISHLNYNYLSEIRLRRGQPITVEYMGEYKYLGAFGITESVDNAIFISEIEPIILSATKGCIYSFTEQIKSGFITVGHGIRIGIAGEYVTQNGQVQTIKDITSLNIRIPHNVKNCSKYVFDSLLMGKFHNILLFSKPGLGKTTMLRDIAINLNANKKCNILIFDERNEIAAINGKDGYNLGEYVDVIRCYEKKSAIASAIRAMKPQIIITDELYGQSDIEAIKYAVDCGINVIASSHVCNRKILKEMPFEYYVELVKIGENPVIYDKNFDIICRNSANDIDRGADVCEQKEENAGVR